MKKGRKHLTLSQRIIIENGLRVGRKIREIAREAGVSRSTVVREIKAYRYDRLEWSCRFGGQNLCAKRHACGVFGVCAGGRGCSGKCGQCRLCNRHCAEFVPGRCREHCHAAPYVCNSCAYVDRCARMHTYYSAERADKLAREAWGDAHAGATVHAAFLAVQFPMVFGILLGDRGSEFGDPTAIGAFGTKVFCCDAGKPGQKGCRREGEPVTRSSWEGVHLKLQIKRRGLGPHGGVLPGNGLFGTYLVCARRIGQETQ